MSMATTFDFWPSLTEFLLAFTKMDSAEALVRVQSKPG